MELKYTWVHELTLSVRSKAHAKARFDALDLGRLSAVKNRIHQHRMVSLETIEEVGTGTVIYTKQQIEATKKAMESIQSVLQAFIVDDDTDLFERTAREALEGVPKEIRSFLLVAEEALYKADESTITVHGMFQEMLERDDNCLSEYLHVSNGHFTLTTRGWLLAWFARYVRCAELLERAGYQKRKKASKPKVKRK
jgi:hypothetical protein